MDVLAQHNYSLYTIPVVWVLALLPRYYAIAIYMNTTKKRFDARQPRAFATTILTEPALSTAQKSTITRAEAATANGFENLTLYAAAVVAGNLGGVSVARMNMCSVAYIGLRVVYNFVYVLGERQRLARVRSLCYMVSTGILMGLFVGAGRNLNRIAERVRL